MNQETLVCFYTCDPSEYLFLEKNDPKTISTSLLWGGGGGGGGGGLCRGREKWGGEGASVPSSEAGVVEILLPPSLPPSLVHGQLLTTTSTTDSAGRFIKTSHGQSIY